MSSSKKLGVNRNKIITWLQEDKIPFKEVDVSKIPELYNTLCKRIVLKEIRALGHINPNYIKNYDELCESALNAKGSDVFGYICLSL